MSGSTLTTRDGLIGNSPRYSGYLAPPYQRYLKDDAGNAVNLTGVASGAFALTMINGSNPLLVKNGGGLFSVVSPATQGLISYQYAQEDLADAGIWYLFVTVQIPGESGKRAFDPDLLEIRIMQGGLPIVTIQQVDLEQLLGSPISTSNPVPTSGPVSAADGAIIALGATTDSSSASSLVGLLKAIKAYLAGTLTTTTTETNSAAILTDIGAIQTSTGAVGDTAWSGSGTGSEIAILKKLVAQLAGTLGISGTVTANAGTSLNTSLLALETGGNLASAKTDLDTIVTQTATPNVSDRWARQVGQVDIARMLGSAVGNSNPLPAQDIEQSGYTSASSPPSATNAGSDTAYTFSSQVSRVIIQNNTSANVNYAFDVAASAGSLLLTPGSTLVYPKKCTVLHLFTAAAQNINGTTAANLVVLGAL